MRILMAIDGSSRATSVLIAAGAMLASTNRRVDVAIVVRKFQDHVCEGVA